MPVTGMANLAIKVADLDAALEWYREAGAEVSDAIAWENGRRADVWLGPVQITLFTQAIYEDACDLPPEGFLHPALFVDDLDAELARHRVAVGAAHRERLLRGSAHRLRGGAGRHPARVHGAVGGPAAQLLGRPAPGRPAPRGPAVR